MKISYSRFASFLQNPERYRLSYCLGLVPEGEDIPSPKNYGRRRGSCFHAIQEANAKGVRHSAITEHKYAEDIYDRCVRLASCVPDLGPLVLPECEFIVPIGDGKHSINGRIDHGFNQEDFNGNAILRIGDFKTTKKRTKQEMREYFSTLETSPQAHFYLYAAAKLGSPTDQFTYHVLVDDKERPQYIPLDLTIGPAEVARKMQGVYAACEAIEGLIERVGIEKSWPHSNHWPCCGTAEYCGFSAICGRNLPKGCVPPGFVLKPGEITEEL